MKIYCCACGNDVEARLTTGAEVYPHRGDLSELPFWRCDTCKYWVGCHHKTKDRTRPLGNIPTPEIKAARQHIHAILDPIWHSGKWSRGKIYAFLSRNLGYQYHTGEIKTIEEARKIYALVQQICKKEAA